LFVSSKTLYILQNLVVEEVQSVERYAVEILDGGYYIPCQAWMDCFSTVLEIIEGVEREVIAMPCYAYTGVYSDYQSHPMTSDGTYSFEYSVPGGELWEVQGFAASNDLSVTTIVGSVINLDVSQGAFIRTWHGHPAGQWAWWSGKVVLSEGQKLKITLYSNLAGDTVASAIHVAKLVLS